MKQRRQAGQITLAVVLFGAVLGVQALRAERSQAASSEVQPRAAHDVVVYRTCATLDDEARQVYADVLRTGPGEISVAVNDLVVGAGQVLASGRRAYVREASSREPIYFGLSQDQRTVAVIPDAEWGRVHRDAGLGVSMQLVD